MTEDDFRNATVVLLADIRSELRELHALMASAAAEDEESDACAHPEDARVSLATPQQPDHWICNRCRYEHAGLTRN